MKNACFLLLVLFLPLFVAGQKKWSKSDSLRYYTYLAQAEFDMVGDYKEAEKYLTKAISIDPTDYELYYYRAYSRDYLGDLKGKESDLDIVIRLEPQNIYAYVGRAQARFYQKKYQEAIEDYDFLILTDPAYAGYYMDRGLAKLALKDLDGACADLQTAAQLRSLEAYRLFLDNCYK